MSKKRNTKLYEAKKGNEIRQYGITDRDLDKRLEEHISDGKKITHICQIGRKMTREGALRREGEEIKRYQSQHGGKSPIYNKNKTC